MNCQHIKEGSYRKICTTCGEENLCYYCVDDHKCEPWKKEFVSRFIPATMEPGRYQNVRDKFAFIENLIAENYKRGYKKGEEMARTTESTNTQELAIIRCERCLAFKPFCRYTKFETKMVGKEDMGEKRGLCVDCSEYLAKVQYDIHYKVPPYDK